MGVELQTKTIDPVSFYIRAGDGCTEIVVLARDCAQVIYRLTDVQLAHLACDATLQITKTHLLKMKVK